MQDPDQNIAPYPCEAVTEVDRPLGVVPHHLPGTNPFLQEFSRPLERAVMTPPAAARRPCIPNIRKLKTMPVPVKAKK